MKRSSSAFRPTVVALLLHIILACGLATAADVVPVEVKRSADGWQLLRAKEPYFIKGAGGGGPKSLLAQLGGNSFRTWGVGDDTTAQLDEAQKLGLTVTLGIWLGHENDGFNYHDPVQVAAQLEKAREAILRYKDHPALLMWGLGNEMEGYKSGDDPVVWNAVEQIAAAAKKLDPNHPTMTVIAEVGGGRVKSIHELCPSVDVVGINSYGGVTSVGDRYRKAGGSKPIVITEFGPPGTWECAKNSWGIPLEPSSTRKGEIYREAYVRGIRAQKSLCLGSYVFTWGHKNEATPTWFGLFLPDDSQLEAVHVMSELWSGKAPANRCPRIEVPKVDEEEPARGEVIHAKVHLSDPDGDPLAVKWVLTGEVKERSTGGAREKPAAMYDQAIVSSNAHEAQIKMPQEAGTYRLFCYAQDGHGNAAVANAVLRVKK